MTKRMEGTDRLVHVYTWASYFFEEYVPAVYALGWMVRTAYWEGQCVGTGHRAREALQQALLLLHAMLGDRAAHNDYGRGIAMALLSWTAWHDQLPGCSFVEESCEAQLSRLGAACKRSRSSFTPEQVNDLYLNVGALNTLPHNTSHHPVAADLVRKVQVNLRRVKMDGFESVVTWVPWKSGRMCTAKDAWPRELPVMRELREVSIEDLLRNSMHALVTVTGGPEQTAAVKHAFDREVPLRSIADRARLRNALETLERARAPRRGSARRRGASPPQQEPELSQRSVTSKGSRSVRRPRSPRYEEGLPLTLAAPAAKPQAPTVPLPTLVGIPDHIDSD